MHSLVEKDDIVIIEFGHFEGGGPIGSIRHNTLCPGLDPTVTCERWAKNLSPPPAPEKMTLIAPIFSFSVTMEKCSTPFSSEFFWLASLPSPHITPFVDGTGRADGLDQFLTSDRLGVFLDTWKMQPRRSKTSELKL